jgi:hypothetical protein
MRCAACGEPKDGHPPTAPFVESLALRWVLRALVVLGTVIGTGFLLALLLLAALVRTAAQ